MSYNNINPTVILDAVRDTLLNDNTLNGAGYLKTTGKIYTRRAPAGAACPYLVIELKEVFENGIFQFKGEFRVFAYTTLLSNNQISTLGDNLLYKCQELLNDQLLTVTGMTSMPMRTSVIPSFFDPEADDSKARGVLRVILECGY